MKPRWLLAACMLLSGSLPAQVRPQPGLGDPRIQAVDYRPDQVVLIQAEPGYQVTIELAPDEQVESAAVGDSGAWQVTANRAGNLLFVKPLQSGVSTNMTVVTDTRTYAFDLSSPEDAPGNTPYTVRFRYAPSAGLPMMSLQQPVPEKRFYRLAGARALQPAGIHDDGVHTYIQWAPDVALPATYAVDRAGRETLANGAMRSGIYVLDGVSERLIFRIDRQSASARRLRPTKAKS